MSNKTLRRRNATQSPSSSEADTCHLLCPARGALGHHLMEEARPPRERAVGSGAAPVPVPAPGSPLPLAWPTGSSVRRQSTSPLYFLRMTRTLSLHLLRLK